MRTVRCAAPLVGFLILAQAALAAPVRGLSHAARGAERAAVCTRSWQIVPSPNSSAFDDNMLLAVSASGKDDAWAVGFLGSGSAGFIGTLTLHWNGSSWNVVDSPNPTSFFNALFGVVAIAPDDAWAVGFYARSPAHFRERPLSMHWDGASWNVVRPPRPPRTVASLSDVDAASSGKVWAVGYSAHESSEDNRTLVESWTGSRWEIVPSPTPRSGVTRLAAVDALNPRKAWAVGVQGQINRGKTLAERWDGRRWAEMASPSVGKGVSALNGVSVRTPTDAWAVGSFQTGLESFQPLAEHFDGRTWSVVTTPRIRGTGSLTAVASRSRHDAWAVGGHELPHRGGRSLVEQWDGSRWAVESVPRPPGSLEEGLSSVALDRAGNVWAVGNYSAVVGGRFLSRTLIERLCRG